MGRVYAVGVGPGSPAYVTGIVAGIITESDIIIGFKYTLKTIERFTAGKDVREITMANQEEAYQKAYSDLGKKTLVVPFTGDVNFSESEVVDRLIEIFKSVEIIPGISAIQVAASRARVPLDKAKVITMHVTTPIENKKVEMCKALASGSSVILIPRPWPKRPDKHFMPSEVAVYLREQGFDTEKMHVRIYEHLTTIEEGQIKGRVIDMEGREFSDLCIMVFDQNKPDSYMNYRWQWEEKDNAD